MGIDVGTSGTRALILDEKGRVVATATADHLPFSSPHLGWAEQHPEDWWRAACLAIPAALAQANLTGHDIACMGFSGQMHGVVLLDDAGQVIRPAIIWCDQRTQAQCDWLTDTIGADRLIQLTCNPALTNFTLTKLLWIREHEPTNWSRVHSILLPKDFIRFRLTGECATDVADASGTLLLDVAHRRWSSEILTATGMDENILPHLHESPEVCGHLSASGAAACGLAPGTPVVAGAGDQAAGAIGMGIVRPGTVSATIGTSGVVFAATDRPVLDPAGRIHTFCHAIPNRWHVMGVTQAAGLSLRWFRDQFGSAVGDAVRASASAAIGNHEEQESPDDSYARLSREAATAPPGCDGMLWAPYLMGERTPHLDPKARAALVGITASHTRAHIVRALMEGVAFSLRDTFTILEEIHARVNRIRLGGGGARSPLWRQIQADVYGHEVEIVEAEEGAAFGAAILAGVGVGMWSSVDQACDSQTYDSQACDSQPRESIIRVSLRVQPNPDAAAVMDASYLAYRRVYPALRGIV